MTGKTGADDRNRTGDLRFTKALLYQLSYIGTHFLLPTNVTGSSNGGDERLAFFYYRKNKP